MRPHVELVREDDLIWHPAELPHGVGTAVQRNLSYDEEDGSASTRVDFLSDFSRPAGSHAADTEWYVLHGEIAVGDRRLGAGAYFFASRGAATPGIRATAGTRILLFRVYGNWDFRPNEGAPDGFELLDTAAMPWVAVPEDPGLENKILHLVPGSPGIVTTLTVRAAGWTEPRYQHHPNWEEAYTISGWQDYNFGNQGPGMYKFRPGGIKHGAFVNTEACMWFLRWQGDPLLTYWTVDPDLVIKGVAQNYDPTDKSQAVVLAGTPLRSRSVPPWSGKGR